MIFAKSQGLNQLWYKDTITQANAKNLGWNVRKLYVINNSDPKGTINFRVPLKHIFGFCEDYDKVVYGLQHTLTLTRNDDEDAIFRANGDDAVEITLNKISWFIPDVEPLIRKKWNYKIIERKEKLPVGYRMIQCDSLAAPFPHPNPTTSFSRKLSITPSSEVPRFIIVAFQTDKSGNQE